MTRHTRHGKAVNNPAKRVRLLAMTLPMLAAFGAGCTTIESARTQVTEIFSGGKAAEGNNASLAPNAETMPVVAKPPSMLLQIEQRLFELGYNPGTVDGQLSARTEAAIQDFQLDNDLKIDGKPSQQLLETLQRARKKSS